VERRKKRSYLPHLEFYDEDRDHERVGGELEKRKQIWRDHSSSKGWQRQTSRGRGSSNYTASPLGQVLRLSRRARMEK